MIINKTINTKYVVFVVERITMWILVTSYKIFVLIVSKEDTFVLNVLRQGEEVVTIMVIIEAIVIIIPGRNLVVHFVEITI